MNSYSIFIERLFLHPFFKINLKKIANCFPTELFFRKFVMAFLFPYNKGFGRITRF